MRSSFSVGGMFVLVIFWIGVIVFCFLVSWQRARSKAEILTRENASLWENNAKLRKIAENATREQEALSEQVESITKEAQSKATSIIKEAEYKAMSITYDAESIKAEAVLLEKFHKEKVFAIPWLAELYATSKNDLVEAKAEFLRAKKHPAISASIEIREMKKKFSESCKAQKEAEYRLLYYQSLVTALTDLPEESAKPVPETSRIDPSKIESDDSLWLSPEEYNKLSPKERAILAFEKYKKKRRRSRWEIGRDYERFIGYEYETKGFNVIYQGIIKGFEDLGRDLICEKRNNKGQVKEAVIVQCKYWSSKKLIHEKHINQLFGTMVEFAARIHEKEKSFYSFWDTIQCYNIKSVLITSTQLSPEAKKFAEILNVDYKEKYEIGEYPMIKCNVNQTTQEKIYHLPYDQMYDYVIIEPKKGELYAMTIDEAEEKGFRRAMRHHSPLTRYTKRYTEQNSHLLKPNSPTPQPN